ncbi:mannosyltransferase [Pusillimonas sp. T7-7]|uniref:glycosyltransferase n=1 Tax=Pusillimonas sp. (strain T7-7) TaxID=1007105 RepID=UPI0002084BB2|nr:glycosyltransferase [Pusillimonas sp. T7-7]AEC21711.1 mannosyltransferase [Pusillimonas sp. T7-7]
MRIVIDMQGAQSPGSRTRGIGRYTLSLAQAIVRNSGSHEVLLALNGAFADTIEPIRGAFNDLLPQKNIRVWQLSGPVDQLDDNNNTRRRAAELAREAFLLSLTPDVVHISSIFEGCGDNSVTSIGEFSSGVPTAVTLFDLIPYIYRKPYLVHPPVELWYERKLDQLRRANLVLAISESSRQEGIQHLGFEPEAVVNISTASDPGFMQIEVDTELKQSLQQRYGIHRPFVMYTGGIDHRKNIEGLIRAYALLPKSLRNAHQLAIVCAVEAAKRTALEQLALQSGLDAGELVLTGFVPEQDLIVLYNLCTAFVFPSWHEGFGLPVLEAMHCGAPVIAANTSSLPEVVGLEDALFDPRSDKSIAAKLVQTLSDDAFRARLAQHGLVQATKFSWDDSARRAITAFENLHVKQAKSINVVRPLPTRRPILAFVSPLPPERSGIADYSAELLPELARYYDIEVVVAQKEVNSAWVNANSVLRSPQWLRSNAHQIDRVLYHFGNSVFHQHMFELLDDVPGTVVLHDFFLSGIYSHQEFHGSDAHIWTRELYTAHGYSAVRDRYQSKEIADVVGRYPANLSVLQRAQGVIVHSEASRRLADEWYGRAFSELWATIPLLRVPPVLTDRIAARQALKLQKDDFVVCSFGMLYPTKLNHRLLEAWLASPLAKDERCVLVFVGENVGGEYGENLIQRIKASDTKSRIYITGWADPVVFRQYLTAADVGVQLRTLSRGETSATVLDCMNYGLPTIINANGSMADIDDSAAWKLPDTFDDAELIKALETLWKDSAKRADLGKRGKEVIRTQHNPRICAQRYAFAIEQYHLRSEDQMGGLFKAIGKMEVNSLNNTDLMGISQSLAANFPLAAPMRQLLIDVSGLVVEHKSSDGVNSEQKLLQELLACPPEGFRVEPIFFDQEQGDYRYAKIFTSGLLNCSPSWATDDLIEAQYSDVFVALAVEKMDDSRKVVALNALRNNGVQINLVICDLSNDLLLARSASAHDINKPKLLEKFDGVVVASHLNIETVIDMLSLIEGLRSRSLKIGKFDLPHGSDMTCQSWKHSASTLKATIFSGDWCTG